MPNWCMTRAHFRGDTENIFRLNKDIQDSMKYQKENDYKYLNLPYFFSLNNFDVNAYSNKFKTMLPGIFSTNFRGNISLDDITIMDIDDNNLASIYPTFETAWDIDYDVLRLISMMYNLEFSAYSEEFGMGFCVKCRNGDLDTYDYDIAISPDYSQIYDQDEEYQKEIDYCDFAGKLDSDEIEKSIKLLKERNIDYNIYPVPEEDRESKIYGVYYDPIPGVIYDTPK